VEDVRTVFERLGDTSIDIPLLHNRISVLH